VETVVWLWNLNDFLFCSGFTNKLLEIHGPKAKAQVQILKSQLATQFTIENNHTADFANITSWSAAFSLMWGKLIMPCEKSFNAR